MYKRIRAAQPPGLRILKPTFRETEDYLSGGVVGGITWVGCSLIGQVTAGLSGVVAAVDGGAGWRL